MEGVEKELLPTGEMLVRLIEEQLWCGYKEVESSVRIPLENENATYLREKVFPTLIPAIYELVKREQQIQVQGKSSSEKYGATGNTHPVLWLAQYLLRNNAHHSKNLRDHPYALVNNKFLRLQKKN